MSPTGPAELDLHHLPHLATRDIHLVLNQLSAVKLRGLGAPARCVPLAPYVRHQRADVLERAGVSYVDLAGALFDLPDVCVHVEGKRLAHAPDKPLAMTPGWVGLVLALLVRAELAETGYRAAAAKAGIALGAAPRYRPGP